MGKPTGFMEFERVASPDRPISERREDYNEVSGTLNPDQVTEQGARCMDCGIPFCHSSCPVDNVIPEWNDLVYHGRWKDALEVLHSTNNFPDVTGRVCPAPCESGCVLGINADPVSIKAIERAIVDRGFEEGWVRARVADSKTGRTIAVVGSGPAGMAAAQQLARAGNKVDLFEKSDRIGGLMRYGIPDFKLDKKLLDRRMEQMEQEGVSFHTGVHIGVDRDVADLQDEYDAVLLAMGAEEPRDLTVPGRDLKGVHFAMDFLMQQNKRVAGDQLDEKDAIVATGKKVVVIGGGDTGSDCVGTANRQGAASIHQLELMPKPPAERDPATPWPYWPNKLRTSTSHEEGCERMWSVNSKEIKGKDGDVQELHCIQVEWSRDSGGPWHFDEVAGSEFVLEADLILLAMGFVHPIHDSTLTESGVDLDERGNVETGATYQTAVPGIFAAGDVRRGASLVVWAIREGRLAAQAIDTWLRADDTGTIPF